MFDEMAYEQEQRLARRQRAQGAKVREMAERDRDQWAEIEARLASAEARLEAVTARLENLTATLAVA